MRFWEKNTIWKYKKFECHTCGAKWESPPYPKNIGGYES
nr:MAG TPA: C2H2 type zinc-finger protein [Caudoviricetes sp.]